MSTGEGLGATDVKDVLRCYEPCERLVPKQESSVDSQFEREAHSGAVVAIGRNIGREARETALLCMCMLAIWSVEGLAACGRDETQASRPQAFPVITTAPRGEQRLVATAIHIISDRARVCR